MVVSFWPLTIFVVTVGLLPDRLGLDEMDVDLDVGDADDLVVVGLDLVLFTCLWTCVCKLPSGI